MAIWGVPALIDIAAKGGGKEIQNQNKDTIAPQKPSLSAIPEATNSAQIVVEGYTEAEVEAQLFLNQIPDEVVKTDSEGKFHFKLSLIKGENEVYVKAKDLAGNESESEKYQIIFDNKPLEILIESPNEGQEFFGIGGQKVSIKGKVNKHKVRLDINNLFVGVDKDGKFEAKVKLVEGENVVKLKARDKAGNVAEKELKLFYQR